MDGPRSFIQTDDRSAADVGQCVKAPDRFMSTSRISVRLSHQGRSRRVDIESGRSQNVESVHQN